MNTPSRKLSTKEHPGLRQSQASNPLQSIWVGASAGTGKTKVLIDRVLRLMLPRPSLSRESATPPGKILCLTFTKTAAAEMSNRIYERLGGWSVKSDAELYKELHDLIGEPPSLEIQEEARRLFARVLDAPGGLKIMTIHSFCQSVLKRFPIEAGLPPHFELMDEPNAVEYLTKCLHSIIYKARENPEKILAQSFNQLALHLDSASMSELMKQIMSSRSLLAGILKEHGDDEGQAEKTIQAIYRHLRIDENATESDILSRSGRLTDTEETELKKVLQALLIGGKKDIEKAALIQPWLKQKECRGELLTSYCNAFFTTKDEIRKKPASKSAVAAYPDIIPIMQKEAERLDTLKQELRSVRLAKLNSALLTVASAMVGHYAQYKRYRDKLDYDDLIIRTCDLLSEDKMVPWVLFKLDEGIDHILVDEAQDTSRNQWRVIESLCGEFFSGKGSRENTQRTLFVVGDEKQSIFSFQGADPREFARMQGFFGDKVGDIQDGWEILLEYSFRSTRTILEVVDAVFSKPETRKGIVSDLEREVRHLPFRTGHAGIVELWPLIQTTVKEKPDHWLMPIEIDDGDNAAARLALKIADTIKSWIDKKEMLASKGRSIRAGDVLILVQSRGAFVDLQLRALKSAGVPVAGVDRIKLTEEIAVMDLLALAQFALLPDDNLTLACLLKSPLIGITEEDLYLLCHKRKGALWQSLRHRKPELTEWLQTQIIKAGHITPYEFFAEALNTPCFADAISGRRALYGRLGFDIQDALDEFLNICLQYEQSHTPSLQKFIGWFSRGETEIKREQAQDVADMVRIMTVHGAKGLQAPIVFLPDTVKTPKSNPKGRVHLIWPEEETGVPLWSPRQEFSVPVYAERQQQAQERQEEEYRRLLYVALTRAEDRLYICGHHGVRSPKPDCWYNLIADAFPSPSPSAEEEDETETIRRLEHPQVAAPEKEKSPKEGTGITRTKLPVWAFQAPSVDPFPPQPLTPSRPDDIEPAAKSPLMEEDNRKFSRGVVVHQILEILPQLPEDSREKALMHYLSRPHLHLPPEQQKSFAAEILCVLRHPDFAAIFGEGSRAEVPVTGFAGDSKRFAPQILSGQIDRILVTDMEVLIIDYKTNRPPPVFDKDIPAIYLKQMAAYRAVIYNIYPKHKIKCALLWTDGPILMPLSDNLLDTHAP